MPPPPAAAPEGGNLLAADLSQLGAWFAADGLKPYRARQVFARLHKNGGCGSSLSEALRDLPAAQRSALAARFSISEPPLAAVVAAEDGVDKLLFDIGGGQQIEAVIIPEARRTTLCISSQAGCALACRFCLTGKQGFARNLTAAEIIAQLRAANRHLHGQGRALVSNVVMMGMGEPLLNADALLPALRLFTAPAAYALPPRRVTVSTAGVVPAMARLAQEAAPVSLAVSLHAPTDSLRDELMPINRKYPLHALLAACHRHIAGRRRALVTFEYVMLAGVNDSPACARDLVRLLHGLRCKVNLIPFNPFDGAAYQCSALDAIYAFRDRLIKSGVMTTIRKTRGDAVLAACGQLAGAVRPRTMGLAREKAREPMCESPLARR